MHEGFWRVPASQTSIHRHPSLSFVVVPALGQTHDHGWGSTPHRPTDLSADGFPGDARRRGAGGRLGGWLARGAAANQPPNWRERRAGAARASRDHTVSISNRAQGVCARACMRMFSVQCNAHERGTAELAPFVGGGAAGGKTQGRHVGKTAGGRHTRAGARTVPPPPPPPFEGSATASLSCRKGAGARAPSAFPRGEGWQRRQLRQRRRQLGLRRQCAVVASGAQDGGARGRRSCPTGLRAR